MKTMKNILSKGLILILGLAISGKCYAESTGASFLQLGIGARQAGLGNAFTGIADDITASYYNPAGLSNLQAKEIGAMHAEWLEGIRYNFIGFVNPLKNGNALGISAVYLYMGGLEGRDGSGNLTGDFGANDLAVTMSFSRRMNGRLNVGVNMKLIRETIADESAAGIGFDMGVLYSLPVRNMKLGVSIQNAGPSMRFINESFNLPLSVSCGVGYKLLNTIDLGLDIKNQPLTGKTDMAFGVEIMPFGMLSIRAGYVVSLITAIANRNSYSNMIGMKNMLGLGLGMGFAVRDYRFDYSFVPYQTLGDTHRISLAIKI